MTVGPDASPIRPDLVQHSTFLEHVFESVAVVFDLVRRAGPGRAGVLAELGLGPALAQQVPALVEAYLQFVQAGSFLLAEAGDSDRLRAQGVFLGDQVVDAAQDLLVVHRSIPLSSQVNWTHHAAPDNRPPLAGRSLYGPAVSVSAESLVRLLAEPTRRKVFAALVLGDRTPTEVAGTTGLRARDVVAALRKLADGGLVQLARDGAIPVEQVFADVARQTVVAVQPEDLGYTDERVAGILRTFVRDGRLLGLPAQRSRRTIVLEHIAQSFEPGVEYSEAAVNDVLKGWSADSGVDHVSLRRYLIDENLLDRHGGCYRRSGGWTDVSA